MKGAGFDATAGVQLIAPGGASYLAQATEVDSFSRITARFAAGSVPAGSYLVRVTRADGLMAELPGGFQMLEGGQDQLTTQVIVPAAIGYHQLATIYVEYPNAGQVAMAAPLLSLPPVQTGRAAALITLDASRVKQGFWT